MNGRDLKNFIMKLSYELWQTLIYVYSIRLNWNSLYTIHFFKLINIIRLEFRASVLKEMFFFSPSSQCIDILIKQDSNLDPLFDG